jgi:hypothetical protein
MKVLHVREAAVGGWIFGGAAVAIVMALLALDWFTAGRAGRRVRGLPGRRRIKSSSVDYNVLQAELRRADTKGRSQP